MLLTALVVVAVTMVVGSLLVLSRPAVWTASASLAVLPQAGDAQTEAGYYETLSRGQIVSTIAEVISAQAQVLPDGVTADVEVLPETSFIRLTAEAQSRAAVTRAADDQLDTGLEAVRALQIPFEPRVVERPGQTVEQVRPDRVKDLAIVALASLGAGLLVQQALALLRKVRGGSRDSAPHLPAAAGD